MIKILICILLVVAILWIICLLVEKGFEISQECDYKKAIWDYLEQIQEFTKLKDKLLEMESAYNELSKRMTQFETDFKTYDEVLENRLSDIESKNQKGNSSGNTTGTKSHPKTKPKAQIQADLKKPLAEKGSNV